MKDTFYKFNAPDASAAPGRIALLADLHDRPFERITTSLKKHKPDIICIAGDTFHRYSKLTDGLVVRQTRNVLPFVKACSELAPSFMSLGNHEWKLCDEDLDVLSSAGLTVLDNSWCRYKGAVIGGLSSAGFTAYKALRRDRPERYPDWDNGDRPDITEPELGWLEGFCKQEGFKILLCHHPEYRDRYLKDLHVTLILSGHAHGGQIRLFGHGLYAPGQGVLPKYTGGIHGNMIISKGLANTAGMIPRLFNPREIVYIDVM